MRCLLSLECIGQQLTTFHLVVSFDDFAILEETSFAILRILQSSDTIQDLVSSSALRRYEKARSD